MGMARERDNREDNVSGMISLPESLEQQEVRPDVSVGAVSGGLFPPAREGSSTSAELTCAPVSHCPGLLPLPQSCMDMEINPGPPVSSLAAIPLYHPSLYHVSQPISGIFEASVVTCNRFAPLFEDNCPASDLSLVNHPPVRDPLPSLDGDPLAQPRSWSPPSSVLHTPLLVSVAPSTHSVSPGSSLLLSADSVLDVGCSPNPQLSSPVCGGPLLCQLLNRSSLPDSSLRLSMPLVEDGIACSSSPSKLHLPSGDLAGGLETNYIETCHEAFNSLRSCDDLRSDPPRLSDSSPQSYSPLNVIHSDSATLEGREDSDEGENPCIDKHYLEISSWLANGPNGDVGASHTPIVTPPTGSNRSKGKKKYSKTPGRGRGSKGHSRT